jgi:hypothetical protein
MTGVDAKHVLELAAAEDEQPVEALATHAADPALGVGVRVRRLNGACGSRRCLRFGRRGRSRRRPWSRDSESASAAVPGDQQVPSAASAPVGLSRRRSGWGCRRRTRPCGCRKLDFPANQPIRRSRSGLWALATCWLRHTDALVEACSSDSSARGVQKLGSCSGSGVSSWIDSLALPQLRRLCVGWSFAYLGLCRLL